ncbi:adenylosuccinate synthetase [Rhodococcus sp. ACS1]|uniref:adenylosuccinate synthetase n=1 Tax=Rhodococcus sp. ACS1 TaxID=2028570 RepID=UPI000BB0D0E8|nr:adenylosuccinate synthetase [Rhodococcus sp. ACS1]PBC39198.1 adenylosuccinate synthetase [Rhodococcus sp. ACS1]
MTTVFGDRDIIVVDLGFGDAGKGATVDWLCSPNADLDVAAVVRFNGGAQAAHNVVVDGRHHTFSQFGSGTFSAVPTVLSRHVLVEPIALAAEARALAGLGVPNPLQLLHIDAHALLTTPIHVAANRAREDARGDDRHGSCGKGIGETAAYALDHPDAPTIGDCHRPAVLRAKLAAMEEHYRDLLSPSIHRSPDLDDMVTMYSEFAAAVRITDDGDLAALANSGRVVFEGAQGVLLDEWRGFHPHTTWSTVEPTNAHALSAEHGHDSHVLGVTRTYTTRHGAGPMPTENPTLGAVLPEQHNDTGSYQGTFRIGDLDEVLLRYATDVCGGVDSLAVTHLDAVTRAAAAGIPLRSARRYPGVGHLLPLGPWQDLTHQQHLTDILSALTPDTAWLPTHRADVAAHLGSLVSAPVVLTSDGPSRAARRVREPAAA